MSPLLRCGLHSIFLPVPSNRTDGRKPPNMANDCAEIINRSAFDLESSYRDRTGVNVLWLASVGEVLWMMDVARRI
jgi:hypothetical protein